MFNAWFLMLNFCYKLSCVDFTIAVKSLINSSQCVFISLKSNSIKLPASKSLNQYKDTLAYLDAMFILAEKSFLE